MKRILAIVVVLVLTATALAANVKFTGSCHVYKKAGSGKLATVISKGSVAKMTNKSGSWVQIQLTDKKKTKVWVRAKYVKATGEDPLIRYSAGGWGYSTPAGKAESTPVRSGTMTWKANMRSAPSLSGRHIITVPKGAKIRLLGVKRADSRGIYWYKASYKGRTGWISNGTDS